MKKFLLPETGHFYKANLHCHSVISDGHLTPEELKQQYMEHGYSIIAYTDHDVFLPHNDLTDEHFLALNGYEMEINTPKTPLGVRPKCCHICLIALEPDQVTPVCWHREKYLFGHAPDYRDQVQNDESEPDYEREYTPECINDIIRRGREKGFFVTYNHPTWSQENYSEYMSFHGMHAMEICNYGCIVEGYPDYNPRVYDDMLRGGERIFCTATDDNHNKRDPSHPAYDSFGGFTVIKAEKLDYRTITKALQAGHFYASQGPEIKELWYEDGELHLTCAPAQRVEFTFGVRRAVSFYAENGQPVTYAHCPVKEDSVYVRATVVDERGKPANTNAYFLDDLNR